MIGSNRLDAGVVPRISAEEIAERSEDASRENESAIHFGLTFFAIVIGLIWTGELLVYACRVHWALPKMNSTDLLATFLIDAAAIAGAVTFRKRSRR
jgi:hypothetical protein